MLDSIRAVPCLICQRPGVEAHHLTFTQPKARGLKAGDQWAVPLCPSHHRALHQAGDERLWWALQGVDPEAWLASRSPSL